MNASPVFRSSCLGRAAAAAALTLLVACGPEGLPEVDEVVADDGVASTGQALSPATAAAACPGRRFIGVKLGKVCPRPFPAATGAWRESALFAPTLAPPGMENYCAYDWIGSPPSAAPQPSALPPESGRSALSWLASDCQVIAPLAELSDQSLVWTRLRQAGLTHSQALNPLPQKAPLAATAAPPLGVRVAVVDTAVEGYNAGKAGFGRSGHGRAVGRAIRELSCPADVATAASPCIGMVSNHLALAHVTQTTVDTALGGFFGTQSELAEAIFRAVESWLAYQKAQPSLSTPRLVVNLSVGWDTQPGYGGPYAGNNTSTLPGPARAVHAALVHAACHGALIIAAAGNTSGGPAPTSGPTYPGGWESKPAPTEPQCAQFEGGKLGTSPFPRFAGTPAYQPLIYAVGGIDARDLPLSTTRVGGRSRLAAYGYQATSRDGLTSTDILTGTSMSAAMASGVGATVWGYRPMLTAHQVMNLLYTSGTSLSPNPSGAALSADFCLGGACAAQPIRRLAACQAIAAACAGGLERCPAAPPSCTVRLAYSAKNVSFPEAAWNAAVAVVATQPSEPFGGAPCVAPACQPPDAVIENKTAQPWVKPQPTSSGCDVCSFTNQGAVGSLVIGTDPSFSTWSSVAVTLQTGVSQTTYNLSAVVSPDPAEQLWQITGIPTGATVTNAQISFGTPAYSTSEQILVW